MSDGYFVSYPFDSSDPLRGLPEPAMQALRQIRANEGDALKRATDLMVIICANPGMANEIMTFVKGE